LTPTATDVIGGLGLPSGRLLGPKALEHVVEAIAAQPRLWAPHVDTTASTRTYTALHRDASIDVWAIFWLPGNDTGWHDHDISSGAVHVVEGGLVEHALRIGKPERRTDHGPGDSLSFDPSHIHRLTCEFASAISIHAYSAPLWRLGQYSVDADGALHRTSVSYADELRPLELAVAA
jgi:predicted metal-dependent enzyme (double-stranded beta helix superfamily)